MFKDILWNNCWISNYETYKTEKLQIADNFVNHCGQIQLNQLDQQQKDQIQESISKHF